MVRPIQQIKRDLATTEDTSQKFARKFYELYVKYLHKFSNSAHQQLMLATYQVCTQNYPELFLALSFNQRQKLQQDLQKIGKESKNNIVNTLAIANRLEEGAKNLTLESPNTDDNSETLNIPEKQLNLLVLTEEQAAKLSNPNQLFQWHYILESEINKLLEKLSLEANLCLQKSEIISNKVPIKVLEVAITAQENNMNIGVNSPNLLNVVVEQTSEQPIESFNPINITAICLRRIDIEFAEPSLSIERQEINNFLSKISQIQKQYNNYKRELAIAEAEAAWRASWFND